MKNYNGLIVYQKGYNLALEIYKSTKDFPKEEIYGLVSQMRRSAVSIPCIIAGDIVEAIVKNMSNSYTWLMDLAEN